MKKNINSIFKEALEKIRPSEEELKDINTLLKKFLNGLEKNKKKLKISAEIFVGGSAAKGTLIKKDYYDIDIFIRFEKKHFNEHEEEGISISDLTEKILNGLKEYKKERIHGSRDYFRIKAGNSLFFEVVPVKKIKNQKEADNITDLSYFHVNYVRKRLKGKVLDEVRLAKAFCHANGCYGAESYIRGFSGYALELLIYHYGSFLKFIKSMTKVKDKLIIDIGKKYKNKNIVLMDLNAAKLQSPVILIDPTHKQRNVLAALSEETFKKFQKACISFLKNPNISAFENKGVNFEEIAKKAKNKRYEVAFFEAETDKQEGDIAGSKLLKFYNHLNEEIKRYFEVKEKGFEYDDKKTAKLIFVARKKKEILLQGPKIDDKENLKRFKTRHRKIFIKNKRAYAKDTTNIKLSQFINNWKKKNNKRMKEMYITDLRIL